MDDSDDIPASSDGDAPETASRLRELHGATRHLMDAQTPEEIAAVATRTARDVLGLEINSVFFQRGDQLVPVAATDAAHELFGETLPTMQRGESMGWRVFEIGEPTVFDDVREAEVMQNPETEIRSELLLPVGEHGVFIAGSTTPAEFSDAQVSIGKVFAANLEAALDRAQREQRLTRQNERLDRFASVVSHDLRNPLNVAQGHLDLAREECDSDHLERVARAHDRIVSLVDDLLSLARQGELVGETERVTLGPVVEEAAAGVGGGLVVHVEDDHELDADRSRLRELLSNLLSNAARHGGDTAWVGWLEADYGFYVEDDGPGIPEGKREQVFEHGYTTSEDGTGFGLAIVEEIATAHGWSVTLTEGDAGGARFEVRLSQAQTNA